MLEALTEWVIDVVEAFGYVGVAFLVLIENLFPPIPSEVVLALAGFTASQGDATVIGMIAAATIGSVGGALVLYGIAAWFGPVRLRRLVVRYGPWLRITERDLDRAEGWFDRWSGMAVLVCRCVPLVRSLISVPAGLRRMPLAKFVAYTTLGSLAWNSLFVVAGYLLGEQWDAAVEVADYVQYAVIAAILACLVAAFFAWRSRGRRSLMPAASEAERDEVTEDAR